VSIMIKKDGTPRGFAFVRFKDPIAADNAVAAQHNLDGRRLDVKAAVSRDSAPSNLSRYSYNAMGVKDNTHTYTQKMKGSLREAAAKHCAFILSSNLKLLSMG